MADDPEARFLLLTRRHPCDITFKDRQFMREYIEMYGLSKEGKCYCYKPYVEKTVANPKSPYIGLRYHACKYGKRACAFFRWKDYSQFLKIKYEK
jgi:hypothetical protein